jgi:hypothetical protein
VYDRTAPLLHSLDAIGVALLLELLAGPATEAELIAANTGADQSTTNRRLHSLKRARLVTQEAGKDRAPGRRWTVVHPAETEALLDALLTLSEEIDARNRAHYQRSASRDLRQTMPVFAGKRKDPGRSAGG